MDDTDTATIELTKGEAREIINALSTYQVGASGRDERRALDIEKFLQREFGFEERQFQERDSLPELFVDAFAADDGGHEIQLSRAEAAEVVPALDELEPGSPPEAETIAELQDELAETFDLDADRAA